MRPLVGTALTLADGTRLSLLVESRAGYRALGRLITRVKARGPKGRTRATLDDLDGVGAGLVCLTGGLDGPLTPDLLAGRRAAARATLARLVAAVGRDRVYVELQRHGTRESELVTRRAVALARDGPASRRRHGRSPSRDARRATDRGRPDGRPAPEPARRARPASVAERRAPPAPPRRDGPPLRRSPAGRRCHRRDRRALRASRSRISAIAFPPTRSPTAGPRSPTCASSSRPARAGGIAP